MNSLIQKLLNKGGAGKSLTRDETVEQLNPLIQQHNELMYSYLRVIKDLDDRNVAEILDDQQPRNRSDIGKLNEVVFSNGGTPPNGTEMEVDDFDLGTSDEELLQNLYEREAAYQEAVDRELNRTEPKPHHFRSKATLENVLANSKGRLDLLEQLQSELG